MSAQSILGSLVLGALLATSVVAGARSVPKTASLPPVVATSNPPQLQQFVEAQPVALATPGDEAKTAPALVPAAAESQLPVMLMDDAIQANEMLCDDRADDCPAEFRCLHAACVPST